MTYKKCYPSWIRTNPKCTKNICATATPSGNMEQIAGIEPTSPTWKEGVITIIRYSHLVDEQHLSFFRLPTKAH